MAPDGDGWHPTRVTRAPLPTLIGLAEEGWQEPEIDADEAPPSTLREDQPLLAEAYRRAAERIIEHAVAAGDWQRVDYVD